MIMMIKMLRSYFLPSNSKPFEESQDSLHTPTQPVTYYRVSPPWGRVGWVVCVCVQQQVHETSEEPNVRLS